MTRALGASRTRKESKKPKSTAVDEKLVKRLIAESKQIKPTMREGFVDYARRRDELLTSEDEPFFGDYAALGLMVRDYEVYLRDQKISGVDSFRTLVQPIVELDRTRFAHTTVFMPRPEMRFPTGIALAAARGEPTLKPLQTMTVIHEWTTKPGKRVFMAFARQFKGTICGKGGPWDQFNNGLVGQSSLPAAIVSAILQAAFSPERFWYPLVTYVALLLVKTGLAAYCEPVAVAEPDKR